MSASPTKVVQDLWGGELPPLDTIDDANELIGALVMGLWNRLTLHQDRALPFRLLRIDTAPTRGGLATLALMRRQELDGFVAGLFGRNDAIDLPEQAGRSLNELAETRAAFVAVFDVVSDETKSATDRDMETTVRHTREMTKSAEHEMHAIVMACARARKQMLAGVATRKPTVH
jgi:citrate lyase beta subunit